MDRWEQIDKLFQQAVDLPKEKRPTFLDRVCGGDPDMRSEIESLLASDDQTPEFLESHDLPSMPMQFVEGGEDPWIGKRLGAWEIQRRLGGGGMGQVYLASRVDGAFAQSVAIKIVKRGMDTDAVLRQFRAERQTLAQLQHPGIARLLDGGSTEDGLPYLVMEFVDGKPLHQFCDEKRLRIAPRLRLFRQVCLAVESAHRAQVVHRDLKPGNILVTPEGTPKLLDFGIAKVLNPDTVDFTVPRTVAGQSFLTPDYASPEQIRGESVTVASDVYSLGVILFELMTGKRPERERTEKPSDVIARPQNKSESTTASWQRGADPARLRAMLRGDLEIIVLKALHPEPERRYASVKDLSEDLRRYQENLPILARPDTLAYQTQKFFARNRKEALAVAAFFLFAFGGVAAIYHYASVAKEKESILADMRREVVDFGGIGFVDEPEPDRDWKSSGQEDSTAMRSRQALALWAAAYRDNQEKRHDLLKEKLLHIILMMEHGIDSEIFSPTKQSYCYYRLALYQREQGDAEGYEKNIKKAASIFEALPEPAPDGPEALETARYLRGIYQQLQAFYRHAGQKSLADLYAAKAEEKDSLLRK